MNFVVKTNYCFYHEKRKFISSSRRVIFFVCYRQEYFHTNNGVKAGNDVIGTFTLEDMETTPLESRFSDQSASGISNAPGTRSVRVNAQGLSRSCCKLSLVKISSPQLAAPGSPRMRRDWPTDKRKSERVNEQMKKIKLTERRTDGWMDGRTKRQNGRTDDWIDENINSIERHQMN